MTALPVLQDISIPHCMIYQDADCMTQLHVFSDVSQVGYGVVAYLRLGQPPDVSVSFVMGKSRAALFKKLISIPHLELVAAVTRSKVAATLCNELEFNNRQVNFGQILCLCCIMYVIQDCL